MRARKLLAMVAGISILTLAIAVPASAATPPTLKIGARGVEYAFETFSTNCPGALPQLAGAFKQAARTGTTIAQNYLDPFWCFGFSMNPVATRVAPMPAPIEHRDYWMLALAVDGNVYGTSSMGGYPTGAFFSSGPRYALEAVEWSCDLYSGGGYACYGNTLHDAGLAASLTIAEDLAVSAAVVYSSIGEIRAACVGYGGTVRAGDTITGGLSPDDGWTWDLAIRARACTPVATINGVYLDKPITDYTPTTPEQIDSYLYRNVFQTVDVYPY